MKQREAYLDWLRIGAIAGVLLFHSAMPWAADEDWHIRDKQSSNILLEFIFFLSRFRMPLLFFVSGAVAYLIIRSKSTGQFIGLRFRRLLIPLVFGMFVIVPPQIYMERLTQGFQGSYFDFYSRVFEFEAYPKGNFSWHHLWFIFYLFVYDIVFAPLFKWLTKPAAQRFLRLLDFFSKGRHIYLLTIPSILWYSSLALRYEKTDDFLHDYLYLVYWLLFLLVGFICMLRASLMESLVRNRQFSLSLAVLSLIAINYFRWNNLKPWDVLPNYASDWRTYAMLGLYSLTAWCWVFALVGYGKKYLNKPSRVQQYMNQLAYPFYILHQTIIVIVTYYVVQTTDTILMKYVFTVIVSLMLSLLLFHLFIKPFAVIRFLFGMKPKERPKSREVQTKEMPIENP